MEANPDADITTPERAPFLALSEQACQSLLALRLLLKQAEDDEKQRLEIIRLCHKFSIVALDEVQRMKELAKGTL